MIKTKRPRVAAIGLDCPQVDSINQLCGVLRTADSIEEYLASHSLTETDVVVSGTPDQYKIVGEIHLFTIGPAAFEPTFPISTLQGLP